MLSIIRKVRRSLIESSSFRKYLFYAIGEIALVVIGILIALQINNWNEDRIRERQVEKHLESLARTVEQDIREFGIAMEFSEFKYHGWQYLLTMSGAPVDTLRDMPRPDTFIEDEVWEGAYPDTINKKLIEVTLQMLDGSFLGFVFNRSAINEINNLGLLSDMTDDSLKNLIYDYYYHLDWFFGEELVLKRHTYAKELKDYLRDQFDISTNYPRSDLDIFKAIQEDRKVIILIKDLVKISNIHYWNSSSLQQRAGNLVIAINDYVVESN